MIYFDNAATGGFKPRDVTDAADNVVRFLSANPGRSGHRLSLAGAEIVYEARKILAETFGSSTEKVIFTKNCTEALNLAIFGTVRESGRVISTIFEHNSVLRPLTELARRGRIKLSTVCPKSYHDGKSDIVEEIEKAITPDTYLVCATAVSNVNGDILPIKEIGEICRKNNLLFLCDGAQGGGHIPIDMKECGISMLALAGHKGLYGIMGSGALLIDDNVDVSPLIFGGTGTESYNLSQPQDYPEKLESGTLNLPAIAALSEGARYIKRNMGNFGENLLFATERLISELKTFKGVKCYSIPNPCGIVAFSLLNMPSGEVADILSNEYDVAIRSGLHCAPLMHKFLGTDTDGLCRVSLAVQNSGREIDYFARAIKGICER